MIVNIPNLGSFELPQGLDQEQTRRALRGLYRVANQPYTEPEYGLGQLLARGFSRSGQQLITDYTDVGPAVGIAAFAKAGFGGDLAKAEEFMRSAEAKNQKIEAAIPARYPDVTEIGLRDVPGYFAEKLGEGLPSLLSMIGPGGIAAYGAKTLAKTAGKEALENVLKKNLGPDYKQRALDAVKAAQAAEQAAFAKTAPKLVAPTLGVVGASQLIPESFREIYQETGKLEPETAIVAGGINAMLDSLIPAKLLGQLGAYGKGVMVAEAAKKAGFTAAAGRIAKGTLATMGQEGLTETAQTAINNVAIKFIDNNYDIFSPENIKKYINSFAAGAASGSALGAVGAAGAEFRSPAKMPPAPPVEPPPAPPVQPPPAQPPSLPLLPPVAPKTPPVQPLQAPPVAPEAPAVPQPPVAPPVAPQTVPPVAPPAVPQAAPPATPAPPVAPPPPAPPVALPGVQPPPPTAPALPPPAPPAPPRAALPAPAAPPPPAPLKPKIPPSLQPRDRSSDESVRQMQRIAENPDPLQLGNSRTFTDGAPLVIGPSDAWDTEYQAGTEDVAISGDVRTPFRYAFVPSSAVTPSHTASGIINTNFGQSPFVPINNGRIAGLKQAYANINVGKEGVKKYRDEIIKIGERLGLQAPAYPDPILVRVVRPKDVPENVGDISNRSGALGMSASEIAKQDAQRVDIANLDFDENGNVTREALGKFISKMPENEKQNLAPNTKPTKDAANRFRNAIFAATYEDDDLIRLVADAESEEAKNLISAMLRAAPSMIQLKGLGEYDVRRDVVNAAKEAITAARRGISVADMARQQDMFPEEKPEGRRPKNQETVLNFFAENIRKSRVMGDELTRVAQELEASAKAEDVDMFGEVAKKSPALILESLGKKVSENVVEAKPQKRGFLEPNDDMFDSFRAELDRLGLADISLEMFEPNLKGGKTSLGQFEDATEADVVRIIKMAILTTKAEEMYPNVFNKQRLNRTLHHEAFHALKSLGLFTEQEWNTLTKAAETDWLSRIWNGDTKPVTDIYANETAEKQLEEAMARAFENYTMGAFRPVGTIAKIFNKIRSFLRKVYTFFNAKGITEEQADIFERILSGEIGNRARQNTNKLLSPNKTNVSDLETEKIIYNAAILDVNKQAMNNLVDTGPTFSSIKQKTSDLIKDKSLDNANVFLAAFNLRQLGELSKEALPQIEKYYEQVTQMLAYRDTRITLAAEIAKKWIAWADANPELNKILADVMNRATIAGMDPETQLKDIKDKTILSGWPKIAADDVALSIYKEVRKYYSDNLQELYDSLKQRIKRDIEDERARTAQLNKLELMFSKAKSQGPYFPLVRFGDYWVSIQPRKADAEIEYYMFESRSEQRAFEEQLVKSGLNKDTDFQSGLKAREILGRGLPMTGFMRDAMKIIDSPEIKDKEQLKDGLWQAYLALQPDLSARKHFIHRKNIEGYSNDAIRGFAETTFHGAYHLARVKFGGELNSLLLKANTHLKENPSLAGSRYLDELVRRHEWVNAPEDVNSFTSKATSFAFLYFLTAPASAIVNIAQTPMVAFPFLGAKFGFRTAGAELLAATKDYWQSGMSEEKGFYDILRTLKQRKENKNLTEKEQKIAVDEYNTMVKLYEDGTLNRTMTLSLSGIAERPQDVLTGGLSSVIKSKSLKAQDKLTYGLGYAFNQAEVFNRQITALAAYRLARKRGMAPDVALATAKDVVNQTHFEYLNATKPRFMQGPTARILFQFKNYAQQMTMLYVRSLQHAFADDPDLKKEARARLGAMLLMTGLFAGYEGLPLYWVIEGTINALFDDEDEPYDFNNDAKNKLADMFGSNVARALSRGPISELLGIDIASRVSQNGMWFRDAQYSADEVEAFRQFVTDLAGPFVGIGVNISDGVKKINDGNTWRGIEAMLPPVLKDFMKVARMSEEGATTLRGDPIVKEVSTWGLFMQALGFTPVDVARSYEVMAEIKGLDKDLDQRRKRLLQQVTLAQMTGDYSAYAEISDKINAFNEKNPKNPITPESIKRSLAQRTKDSERAVRGVIVNPKREYLLEQGRYLGEEEED